MYLKKIQAWSWKLLDSPDTFFFVVEIIYFITSRVPRSSILQHCNVSDKCSGQLWVSVLTILVHTKQFMVSLKICLQAQFSCWTLSLLVSVYQLNSRSYRCQAVEFESTIQPCKDGNIALVAMTIPTWSKSQKILSWRRDRDLGWESTRIFTFCSQTAILRIND